ncbi:universal stress protein [Spirosoma sp. KNUC1025]|uniref:universal stress protein n=1 Tax=Spirosoma sp. KNUC1025 TaxID=2894082 RepID=UPI003864A116|nr:universal stress protein [Spirosoma sp. KNUC1025]
MKILLLTDFSAASKHAIAYAQALFADTAADFCFLYACPIEPEMEYAGATLLAERWQAAEPKLVQLRAEMTQQPEPGYHTYRTLLKMGAPTEIVNQLQDEDPFDLIVLGASGSGWSEWMGSVATDMVREAKTNVLVVPAAAPIRPLEQLVLATDYRSINNTKSLTLLDDLASRKAAQLILLTIENPQRPGTHTPVPAREFVLAALDNVQTTTYTIHDDNVLHGINTYLKTHTVDLLVMVPHHKSLFDVLSRNSISRSIAFHPSVPLLTLYDEAIPPVTTNESSAIDEIPFATYL